MTLPNRQASLALSEAVEADGAEYTSVGSYLSEWQGLAAASLCLLGFMWRCLGLFEIRGSRQLKKGGPDSNTHTIYEMLVVLAHPRLLSWLMEYPSSLSPWTAEAIVSLQLFSSDIYLESSLSNWDMM